MEIEFDPAKEVLNRKRRKGLSLSLAEDLDWDDAVSLPDNRFHYDEIRMNALVPMGNRLYHVTYTERRNRMRVISLRYAERWEVADYVKRNP